MKDYYRILGVSPTAHASDIKRAYRRLVQQLHPDINPDPQATELIKEVNEAYDVLGDPVKRSAYDYTLQHPFSTIVVAETPPHRDRAYRRRGAYKPPPPKGPTHNEMIEWVMPYLINIARVGLGVCLILLIDIMLPAKRNEDTIRHFYVSDTGRGNATIMVSESGRELKLRREDFVGTHAGDPIIFVETRLLKELLRVEGAGGRIILNDFASLYDNFLFLPLIVGCCSLMIAFKIGAAELRFNLGIVNTFVLIFTIILMF
ncbi:MAG: DnaJ domain-containing protein [Cyclobacteriaceae bacterium]|nr:DnaJ domain-containing protein [Cyclobacteriaceae bacterium]